MPSRIAVLDHDSAALRGNALGDPQRRPLPVYLPDGYDGSTRRYPVLWWLAGFAGIGADQLRRRTWEESLPERLDRLIASGAMPPVLAALPDGMTRLGGGQWIDSAAAGAYQSALVEAMALVDAQLRTLPAPAARGVIGHSSGGYGALRLALDRPGTVGAVCARAPDCGVELSYLMQLPKVLRAAEAYPDLAAVVRDPLRVPHPRHGDFFALMECLAMASCYAPDATEPLGFALPVELPGGRLRPEVIARWKEHDLVELMPRHAERVRSLALLWIECGTRDEFNLHYGCRAIVRSLRERGVPVHAEEFPGGHMGTDWRLDLCLPAMARAITP